MADRRVTSSRFPYLPLSFTIRDRTLEVQALLDTGFDGDLVVSPDLVLSGRPADGYSTLVLADGSEVEAAVYLGTVTIGEFSPIEAGITVLGDEPIVGLGIASRFLITLDHGQRVIVEL